MLLFIRSGKIGASVKKIGGQIFRKDWSLEFGEMGVPHSQLYIAMLKLANTMLYGYDWCVCIVLDACDGALLHMTWRSGLEFMCKM